MVDFVDILCRCKDGGVSDCHLLWGGSRHADLHRWLAETVLGEGKENSSSPCETGRSPGRAFQFTRFLWKASQRAVGVHRGVLLKNDASAWQRYLHLTNPSMPVFLDLVQLVLAEHF